MIGRRQVIIIFIGVQIFQRNGIGQLIPMIHFASLALQRRGKVIGLPFVNQSEAKLVAFHTSKPSNLPEQSHLSPRNPIPNYSNPSHVTCRNAQPQQAYNKSSQYQIQLFLLFAHALFKKRMHTQKHQVLRLNPPQAYDTHHNSNEEDSSLLDRQRADDRFAIAEVSLIPPQWDPVKDQSEPHTHEDRHSQRQQYQKMKGSQVQSDYEINIVESKHKIQPNHIVRHYKATSGKEMMKELRVESRHKLRTDIFVSSGDCQQDLSENSNELPLASICRPKSIKCYKQWQDSDDLHQLITRKKGILPTKSYMKDRQESLELSSDEDFLQPCRKCRDIGENYTKLLSQNKDLHHRLVSLQEQLSKSRKLPRQKSYQSSTNSNDEISSSISLQLFEPTSLQTLMFQQLSQANKTVKKYLEGENKEEDGLTEEEIRIYEEVTKNLEVLGKEVNIGSLRNEKFAFLHEKYKGIIDKLKKYYCDRLHRLQIDFKNVMAVVSKKSQGNKADKSEPHEISFEQHFQTHPRKLQKARTYIQKEELNENIEMEELKKRISQLQNKLEKQKNRAENIERYTKRLMEKYNTDVSRLAKERNSYMQAFKKSTLEFASFMSSLVKKTLKFDFFQGQFFKKISQRIFEVSNSIPFQDNDQQNLFAAQNEEELLDMVERIRRFYFHMEQYNAKKAREEELYKRSVILFLKDLVETEKVSLRVLLELIKKYKDLDFEYIKNHITAIREKRGRADDRKASPLRRRTGKANTESITKANFELSDEADRQ